MSDRRTLIPAVRARRDRTPCGIQAVAAWVTEWAEDSKPFGDRAGPTVGEHERQRVRFRSAEVQEVDCRAVNRRRELRVGAICASPAPVGLLTPVLGQLAHHRPGHAVSLIASCAFRCPSSRGEPVAEVGQIIVRDVDSERRQLVVSAHIAQVILVWQGGSVALRSPRCRHGVTVAGPGAFLGQRSEDIRRPTELLRGARAWRGVWILSSR